jgi:toxin ParE1/3/4
MAHRLAPRVHADLDAIWEYVARESRGEARADQQIDSITERFDLLASHPYLGRTRDEDLGSGRRSFPVGRHVIVYRVVGGDVSILRVVNGSRDLGGAAIWGLCSAAMKTRPRRHLALAGSRWFPIGYTGSVTNSGW